MMANLDEIRAECWTESLHCFGTSYIFEQRANLLRKRLRILTFLGIGVPAAVGGAVAAFGIDFRLMGPVLTVAGVLLLTQLIGSVWSLTSKWEDGFAYSLESLSANRV